MSVDWTGQPVEISTIEDYPSAILANLYLLTAYNIRNKDDVALSKRDYLGAFAHYLMSI